MYIRIHGKPHANWYCPVCHRRLRVTKRDEGGSTFSVKTDTTDCREILFGYLIAFAGYFKQVDKLSLQVDLPRYKQSMTTAKDVTTAMLLSVCKPDFLPAYTDNRRKINFPKQVHTYGPLMSMLVRPLQRIFSYHGVSDTDVCKKLNLLLHQNAAKALCGKTPHSAELRSEVARTVVELLWNNLSEDAYASGFAMFISIVHSIGGIKALYAKYDVDSLQHYKTPEETCLHQSGIYYYYDGMASFLDKYFVANDDRVISTICKQFLDAGVQNPEQFIIAKTLNL